MVIRGICLPGWYRLHLIIANPYKSSSAEKCILTFIHGMKNINTYFDVVFITYSPFRYNFIKNIAILMKNTQVKN